MPASYLSPKTRVGKSAIEGKGLFARRRIRKGEIVAIKGGHVYDVRTLAKVKRRIAVSYIQIADRFFIGALTAAEVARNKIFINQPLLLAQPRHPRTDHVRCPAGHRGRRGADLRLGNGRAWPRSHA